MSDFDYDQLVIGSGFGGSVAALRLAERMMGVVPDRYFHGEGLEALRNAARDAGCGMLRRTGNPARVVA